MSNRGHRQEKLEVKIEWTKTRFPPKWRRSHREAMLQAILEMWIAQGQLPNGFELRVSWRNPDNHIPQHADWKAVDVDADTAGDPDQEQARITLNRGGWLASAIGGMRFTERGRR